MTTSYDDQLDGDIALITSQIAGVHFDGKLSVEKNDTKFKLPNKENEDNDSAISRSFMLDELLDTDTEDISTLEVYKDILNEKINSKTKIPTPSVSQKKKTVDIYSPKLAQGDSRLPVSISNMKLSQRSPTKRDSMSSMRSVSDSPSTFKPRILAAHEETNTPSNYIFKQSKYSERRRKVQSMILPSQRLVSAPMQHALHQNTNNMDPVSTPTKSRLPSYLKQTTSSLKKAIPNSRENKENNQLISQVRTTSSSASTLQLSNKRKSFSGTTLPHKSLKTKELLSPLEESPISRRISLAKPAAVEQTLKIPKIRLPRTQHNPISHRPSFMVQQNTSTINNSDMGTLHVPKRITRSQTQDNLNASLHGSATIHGLRKTSTSLEKRKVTPNSNSSGTRSTSITVSKKISSVAELYKAISKSSLVKTWERAQNHHFAKIDPIQPMDLQRHSRYKLLNNYERGEILRRSQIYYVGDKPKPEVEVLNFDKNFGFDDKENNYIINTGDHINYRFRVLSSLGNGAFGSVVACNDYKQDRICAVKIVKNEMTCSLQAVSEVKLLKYLATRHPERSHLVKYYSHFHFRGHMCISTEYLPINLYQVLEISNFKGFKMSVISDFASQILHALNFLHSELGIIHCDLKPENLMLISPYSFELKLIDLGSAVGINEISYSYLQSRFYRAPEVTLGARYNEKIDIWSFATILIELFSGIPLFPCENENGLMIQYLELLGEPAPYVIQKLRDDILKKGAIGDEINESSLLWQIFNGQGQLSERELRKRARCKSISINSKNLHSILRVSNFSEDTLEYHSLELFIDMIHKCLVWDYDTRASAQVLLQHEFLTSKYLE